MDMTNLGNTSGSSRNAQILVGNWDSKVLVTRNQNGGDKRSL